MSAIITDIILNKTRKVSADMNVSGLVSLLNGLQVVRTIKLLRLLGCVDYIRKVSKSRIVCGSLLMLSPSSLELAAYED